MKITALRQIVGDYGLLAPEDSCDVRDDIGKHLIQAGLARPFTETRELAPEVTSVQLESSAPKIENKKR